MSEFDDKPQFLDVQALLAPPPARTNMAYVWYFVGGFLLVMMGYAYFSNVTDQTREALETMSFLAALGLIGVLVGTSFYAVRRHRADVRKLEAAEEFIQLRSWPQAAISLQDLLQSQPRMPAVRIQALMFLSGVLARYHRFDDAIEVQNYILDHVMLDDGTVHNLRLGRAMAMLREDHLFDADRAISELRRTSDRSASAGLALVEIYRDVKTGHLEEAIRMFEEKQSMMRQKLGHRVADGWALVARAFDLLGREDEARRAWANATVLSPAIELTRRYPETARTAEKFSASVAPMGM